MKAIKKIIVAMVMVCAAMLCIPARNKAEAATCKYSSATFYGTAYGMTISLSDVKGTTYVVSKPDWLTVTGSGSTYCIRAGENPSEIMRQGDVVFGDRGDNSTCKIRICQAPKEYITATPDNHEFSFQESTWWLDLTHVVGDVTTYSIPSWAKLEKKYGTYCITVEENKSSTPRNGCVQLWDKGSGMMESVTIRQQGVPTISVSQTNKSFTYTGGSQFVTLSNVAGTARIDSYPDWMYVYSFNGGYYISVYKNTKMVSRTGSVKFKDSLTGKIATVTITQGAAPVITVNKSSLSLDCYGSLGKELTFGNVVGDVRVYSKPSWIYVGKNGNEMTVYAFKNTDTTKRTGVIQFRDDATGKIVSVSITQEGMPPLKVDKTFLFYDCSGDSQSVNVLDAVGDVNVSLGKQWLWVMRFGDEYAVVATQNWSGEPRTGSVTFTDSMGKHVTVSIFQEAAR